MSCTKDQQWPVLGSHIPCNSIQYQYCPVMFTQFLFADSHWLEKAPAGDVPDCRCAISVWDQRVVAIEDPELICGSKFAKR
jgi:hypothetical protein